MSHRQWLAVFLVTVALYGCANLCVAAADTHIHLERPPIAGRDQRKLLSVMNAVESQIEIVIDSDVTFDRARKQYANKFWFHIERDSRPNQPQLRPRTSPNEGTTTRIAVPPVPTVPALPQCTDVVNGGCKHTFELQIGEECGDIIVEQHLYPASLWCAVPAIFFFVPGEGSDITADTITTRFTAALMFTTKPNEVEAERFPATLNVTISLLHGKMPSHVSPFPGVANNLELYFTGPCEYYLARSTSFANIPVIDEVTPGDRLCIVMRASTPAPVNLDLEEVSACIGDDFMPIGSVPFTGFRGSIDPEYACSRSISNGHLTSVFSLRTPECAKNGGSCGKAGVTLNDNAVATFPCLDANATVGSAVCAAPSIYTPDANLCPLGFQCASAFSVDPFRTISDFPVPNNVLRPYQCWKDSAEIGDMLLTILCVPTVNDALCVTPCVRARNVVVAEFTVPLVNYAANSPNSTLIQYDIRGTMRYEHPATIVVRRTTGGNARSLKSVASPGGTELTQKTVTMTLRKAADAIASESAAAAAAAAAVGTTHSEHADSSLSFPVFLACALAFVAVGAVGISVASRLIVGPYQE